jgi:transposase
MGMKIAELRDNQWEMIYRFLQQHPRAYTGKEAGCRQFVQAVLWILRSGAQWRLLPESHGQWNSIYKRFARWCEHGVWTDMHQHFANNPDMENILLDSTILRAHPCAAGASKKDVGKKARRSGAAGAGSAPRSTPA